MQNMRILNSREIKQVVADINGQFGCDFKPEGAFLENNEGRLYIISKKFGEINDEKIRISTLGLYFGKREAAGIRLSIEGSQLIFPTRNTIELDDKQISIWMQGKDIEIGDKGMEGFVIITHKGDSFGCGHYKNGKIQNYVPKSRRLNVRTIG